MTPAPDASRWQRVRQDLMHRWPALIRSLPEQIQIVRDGGAIGLTDGSVVMRADWLGRVERSELVRAALHLAGHAALGHRPWRQHPSVRDARLDGAVRRFLSALGIDSDEADWSGDHHGAWPGVQVRAPGETWAARGESASARQSDPGGASSAPSTERASSAERRQDERAEVDEPTFDAHRSGVAGDLRAQRVMGRASARISPGHRQTDWRALLRLWLVQRSHRRWQFDRPARRRVEPFILPRLSGRQLRVAVALDISGSIDPRWFAQFFREIEALRGLVPLQLRLLTCDNRIHLDRALQGAAVLPPITGGGGTDFRPVFARLAGDAALDALIYCTDLIGDYPATIPPFPVFWLVPEVVRTAAARPPDPPFGRVLMMRETAAS